MLKALPRDVDYDRQPQPSGAVVYLFRHPTIGYLGCLYLFAKDPAHPIRWEAPQFETKTVIQTELDLFMTDLLKDLTQKIKKLEKRKWLTTFSRLANPVSTC